MGQIREVNPGWGLVSIANLRGKADHVDGPRSTPSVRSGRKFPAIALEWKASTQTGTMRNRKVVKRIEKHQ